jgi:hypothetical protein
MKVGVPNGQILYKDRLAHQMQPLIAILKIEWEGLVARLPCARPPRTVAAACGKNHDRKNREQKDWFHSSKRSAVQRSRITRNRGVAKYILQHARSEVGKLCLSCPRAVPHEPAFLEDAPRCPVFRMAKRVESRRSKPARQIAHRGERLGRVALAPRVLRQYVTGHRVLRGFESQTSTTKESAIVA